MAVSGSDIVAFAKQYIGTPYVWGGNSLSKGVDCSGLVQQVYKQFGLSVSRTTFTQIGEGKAVDMNNLQAGDMIFFDTDPKVGGPDHVGIYMGNGKMIHAPRPGKSVEISDMTTGYWQGIFMGGRRISGITGGGPSGEWEPGGKGAEARLNPEELAAEYGWAYSFLNSIPSVKSLFKEYVAENWTKEKFMAKLRETDWWKKNSDTMRKAQQEKSVDPATYKAKQEATSIQIRQLAADMGAIIPDSKLAKITEQLISTGADQDEGLLRNILGGYVKFTDDNTLRGQAGMVANSLKEFAYSQGVEVDKQALLNQSQLVVRGMGNDQDFKNQIVAQAASAYPAYTQQLQAGQTMMEIANPYIQQMAEDLDLPISQIKLSDPLIKQALNGTDDSGKPVGMDLTTFQNVVRTDPRWGQTNKAQDNVMGVGLKVLQDMGLAQGR